MNNKIKNPKTEVPETLEMNDKDYMTTMLTIEKGMVKDVAVIKKQSQVIGEEIII